MCLNHHRIHSSVCVCGGVGWTLKKYNSTNTMLYFVLLVFKISTSFQNENEYLCIRIGIKAVKAVYCEGKIRGPEVRDPALSYF